MTTYSKETALYDTGAIANDINAASLTAEKYITRIDDAGIKVHAYDDEHDVADNDNYTKITSDGMEVFKDGDSVADFGSTVRLGGAIVDEQASGSRTEILPGGVSIYSPNNIAAFEVQSSGSQKSIWKSTGSTTSEQVVTLNNNVMAATKTLGSYGTHSPDISSGKIKIRITNVLRYVRRSGSIIVDDQRVSYSKELVFTKPSGSSIGTETTLSTTLRMYTSSTSSSTSNMTINVTYNTGNDTYTLQKGAATAYPTHITTTGDCYSNHIYVDFYIQDTIDAPRIDLVGNVYDNGIKLLYEPGDSITYGEYNEGLVVTGFVTSSKTEDHYTIPLPKPCVASTVTITNFGLICRQDSNYVHNTAATTYRTPSYTATLTGQDSDGAYTSIRLVCTWSNTSDVVNNAPIAANIRGVFTFA